MLIDDDDTTNYLHKRVIDRSGLVDEVVVATDGQKALGLLAERSERQGHQPDVIFLDINMPGMDGFEFLEAYSALGHSQRGSQLLIMLTTSLLESDHRRALGYDLVDEIINKPLTVELLQRIVAA
jgi:CheY-like chemotaxis protein